MNYINIAIYMLKKIIYNSIVTLQTKVEYYSNSNYVSRKRIRYE